MGHPPIDPMSTPPLPAPRKAAESAGASCVVHTSEGEPVAAILAVAGEQAADLIVVGNKGMEHRLLKSVPDSVAHRAHSAVLIVATT